MNEPGATIASQIGKAALEFEKLRTGHAPKSVTVVLTDDALVITLQGGLSPAEQAVARNPAGAAQLQELHDALFVSASGRLREQIETITGVPVRDASAGIESGSGSVIRVFATGTIVQVFLLAGRVAPGSWSGSGESGV